LTTLAPSLLLERLATEYVYAQLCEAAIHAFAAENEARMMAMASAKTNIESKLAGLSQRGHQLRQEETTTEIVELAAGAEELSHVPESLEIAVRQRHTSGTDICASAVAQSIVAATRSPRLIVPLGQHADQSSPEKVGKAGRTKSLSLAGCLAFHDARPSSTPS
jgi:hypothetical protein